MNFDGDPPVQPEANTDEFARVLRRLLDYDVFPFEPAIVPVRRANDVPGFTVIAALTIRRV